MQDQPCFVRFGCAVLCHTHCVPLGVPECRVARQLITESLSGVGFFSVLSERVPEPPAQIYLDPSQAFSRIVFLGYSCYLNG